MSVEHARVLCGDVITDVTGSEAARRRPVFVPEAIDRGVKSIIAVPIQAGAIKMGVVDCYREPAGLPSSEGQAEALTRAEAAVALAAAEDVVLRRVTFRSEL
ncbi:hypothetical protein AB0N89_36020 [Amycolatopsis sp. NPDC089917]|uniref:hypothetical protein n=1 Tax=Amycolatopsis sp. NPDC089917 TaxID=3155187 RepID=UPI00344A0B40